MPKYDTIIGGGLNGLVTAAYLDGVTAAIAHS
jgi:phytoene dehydrogenase-like protein